MTIAEHSPSPNTSFDYISGVEDSTHNTGHSEIIPLTKFKDDTRIVNYLSSEEERDEPQNILSAPKKELVLMNNGCKKQKERD